jgi:hypothetical protein
MTDIHNMYSLRNYGKLVVQPGVAGVVYLIKKEI